MMMRFSSLESKKTVQGATTATHSFGSFVGDARSAFDHRERLHARTSFRYARNCTLLVNQTGTACKQVIKLLKGEGPWLQSPILINMLICHTICHRH